MKDSRTILGVYKNMFQPNTIGVLYCIAEIMNTNILTCVFFSVTSGAPRKLYVAIGNKVIKMDPTGSDQEDVLKVEVDDLDFDIKRNLMFWIDGEEKKVK